MTSTVGTVEHPFHLTGHTAPPAFDPIDLFYNSEDGIYRDYSDRSTMFQDKVGSIAVTADGQPVSLILDKSKGLALGEEKVVNGTFDADIAGWDEHSSFATGALNYTSGRLHFVAPAERCLVGQASAQKWPITAGKYYKIVFDLEVVSGTGPAIQCNMEYYANNAILWGISNSKPPGTYHFEIIGVGLATGSAMFNCDTNGVACEFYLDNVSIKELAGNHTTFDNPATYHTDGTLHWLEYDGANDWGVAPLPAMPIASTLFEAITKLSTARVVLHTPTPSNGSSFIGVAESGGMTQYADQSAGRPLYRANGADIGWFRDDLYNALPVNVPTVLTLAPVDLLTSGVWDAFGTGFYTGYNAPFKEFAFVLIGREVSEEERASTEQWLAEKSGAVVPFSTLASSPRVHQQHHTWGSEDLPIPVEMFPFPFTLVPQDPRIGVVGTVDVPFIVDGVGSPGAPPYSITPPTIAGEAVVAATLTYTPGTWGGVPVPSVVTNWARDNIYIIGTLNQPTYTVQQQDRGHAITCIEEATNLIAYAQQPSNEIIIPASGFSRGFSSGFK
jgi:hypothetical protein